MVVRVLGRVDCVLDQFLERGSLADELDELRDAATSAEHHELFLLEKQLLDGAAILLVQKLVDLDVASADTRTKIAQN